MTDCLFCNIANKKINSTCVYEDNDVIAFNDIHPKAPIHILIIPRQHIATLNDIDHTQAALVGKLMVVAKQLAKKNNIADSGYRVVMNCNNEGGQEIYHIHLHLLGGRQLHWNM